MNNLRFVRLLWIVAFISDHAIGREPAEQEGQNAHSLQFRGHAHVSIPFVALGVSAVTIEVWFKPAADLIPPIGETVIFALVNGNSYSDGILANDHMGNLGGYTYADTFNELNCSERLWKRDRWYHLVYVRDAQGGQRLFLNGKLDAKDSCFGRIQPNTEINIGGHGSYRDGGRWFFSGKIDEVRIWKRALTPEEIQASHNRTPELIDKTGLAGYWDFNEGAGNVLRDRSGNGHDGIIHGATWSDDVPKN